MSRTSLALLAREGSHWLQLAYALLFSERHVGWFFLFSFLADAFDDDDDDSL
jgi:hypothetical protein